MISIQSGVKVTYSGDDLKVKQVKDLFMPGSDSPVNTYLFNLLDETYEVSSVSITLKAKPHKEPEAAAVWSVYASMLKELGLTGKIRFE